jgi:octaprenyl-diphosphate synthase
VQTGRCDGGVISEQRQSGKREAAHCALKSMGLPALDKSGGSVQQKIPTFRLIDDELLRVRQLIDEQLARVDETEISRLLRDFSSCSGKMLRPGLVLLAGASCGKITDEHIRVAAIAEVIHNATLLHDDVIDEGKKRRGRPTINSLWGNERAVLLGDYLLSRVFEMCAVLEAEVVRIIAGTTVRICEGELRQVVQRRNLRLRECEYIDIITEKSAALFGCCCSLGAMLSGADEKRVGLLADFGLNFGIAFQITDDLLDIIGDEKKTGKTVGSDAGKNKVTLAVIHLLGMAEEGGGGVAGSNFNGADSSNVTLAETLRSSGSLQYAQGRAEEYVRKAIGAVADLEESEAKESLIATAKFIGRLDI